MYNDATINLTPLIELHKLTPALSDVAERLEKALDKIKSLGSATLDSVSDPWLTAEQARKYLGNMSKGTFDKYRYETNPRINGHKLGGKMLYKKIDLDNFVRLFELKSAGVA